MKMMLRSLGVVILIWPLAAAAQEHQPGMTHAGATAPVIEPGQGAFAAIGEIVARPQSDPATDWTRVDIEALRQHLIDMDNVTLRSAVEVADVPGGAVFSVSAIEPDVVASIVRMVSAHAATMDDPAGWRYQVTTRDTGAVMTVTGDAGQIRALGFVGVLTVGMHHQSHHWAIATGAAPHD
jgi:hypothetical protein